MNSKKYVGLDVHQATIAVAVLEKNGRVDLECLLKTKAATSFLPGYRAAACDVRGRHVPRLALRSAEAPHCLPGSLQSTKNAAQRGAGGFFEGPLVVDFYVR